MQRFHQNFCLLIVGANTMREREHTFVLSVKIFINKATAFLLPLSEPFFAAKVPLLSSSLPMGQASVPFSAPLVPFLLAKAPMAAPSVPLLPEKAPTVAPLAPISPPLAHKTLKFFNFSIFKH